MTTPPEGTQPPTGPQDPYATPAGGGPAADPYGAPPAGGPYGAPPPGPYGSPQPGPYGAPSGSSTDAPQGYGAPPAGAYGAPPEGYGGAAPAGDDRPTDVVSIVGLVLGFLLAPVGLVLSLVGIARTAGGKRKGRGLAVAGVIVSVVMTLVAAAAVVALVLFARTVAEEGGAFVDELEALPTSEPFTMEPFPEESVPVLPDGQPVDPASLLALGEPADLDGLVLTVTGVDLDADADVAGESADNPPPSGRYVLVSGTVENTTDVPQEVYLALNVGYLSAPGSLYDEFTCSATVAGSAVDTPLVEPGASADVRWCLDVPVQEVGDGSVQVEATGSGTAAAWTDR